MWLKCSLCSKNCFLPYSRLFSSKSRYLELPITRTFFDFPWRFELSGVDYISAKAKKSFVTVSNQWILKYSLFFSLTNLFDQNWLLNSLRSGANNLTAVSRCVHWDSWGELHIKVTGCSSENKGDHTKTSLRGKGKWGIWAGEREKGKERLQGGHCFFMHSHNVSDKRYLSGQI